MVFNVIDGYKKIEGRYPTYQEYLIYFKCSGCKNVWAIDEAEIKVSVLDELSHVDDLISDSIQHCPLCGSAEIARS